MARTSTSRRRERDTDPMDSLKPLIVLGLLGTIMYGAYSVVQKGPAPSPVGSVVDTTGSAFAPPEITLPRDPTAIGVAPSHPLAGAEPLHASAVPPGVALPPPKIQRDYEEPVCTSSQPCITSFRRFRAIFNSLSGVCCDFFINACRTTIFLPIKKQ